MVVGLTQTPMALSRIEFVDEDNKVICYKMVGGDLLNNYTKFVDKIALKAREGGGSIATYTTEYEKTSEHLPDPLHIKDFSIDLFNKLDAYLQEEGQK